jgi:hypothetical protein
LPFRGLGKLNLKMIRNLILKRFFATTKNLYSILGIAENSSASEIKKAYIEVSKRIN